MKIPPVHRWDLTPSEALALQRELADRVIDHDEIGSVHYVAGVDVGFEGERNRAAVGFGPEGHSISYLCV